MSAITITSGIITTALGELLLRLPSSAALR